MNINGAKTVAGAVLLRLPFTLSLSSYNYPVRLDYSHSLPSFVLIPEAFLLGCDWFETMCLKAIALESMWLPGGLDSVPRLPWT